MYKLKHLSKDEHDEFVKNHPYGELTQLYNWDKTKPDWESAHVGVKNNGQLIAVALVLFRKMPMLPYYLAYIPKGPVVNWENFDEVQITLELLSQFCKEQRAFAMKVDPMVSNATEGLVPFLKDLGYYHHGFGKGFIYAQPRYYMITDIDRSEQDLMQALPAGTRNIIRKAKRSGLICERKGRADLETFAELIKITGERNNFGYRSVEYFENLYDALGDDCELYLTYLLPTEVLTANQKEKKQIAAERKGFLKRLERRDLTDRQRKNYKNELNILDNREKRCQKRISQMEDFIQRGIKKVPLVGALITFCGKKAEYLYAGSSNEFRDLNPNYLMQWVLMKRSMKRGCTTYNFGGVTGYLPEEKPDDPENGLYLFKSKFATETFETIGEFDNVLNKPVDALFRLAFKLRSLLN